MRYHSSRTVNGFSLLEVMISVAIIGIITAIVVIKYASFNNSVLLKNQAYEIALDIREAQTFAVSVKGDELEFREDYGMSFLTAASSNQEYIFFVDTNSHSSLPPFFNSGDTLLATRLLDSRFEIDSICVNNDSNCDVPRLDVSFKRPDFDAQFFATGVSNVTDAKINIISVSNPSVPRSIIITNTGQIRVE